MFNPLTWLSRRRFPYEPLITVEISKDRLKRNLGAFVAINKHGSVAPVLKSNAYGHGLMEVAEVIEGYRKELSGQTAGHGSKAIPFCVVDSYFEAVALRSGGIKMPILIIGFTRPETVAFSRLKNVSFAVTSMEMLKEVTASARRPLSIHLKIDTGMSRQGVNPKEIKYALDLIASNPLIHLDGVCSHMPDADGQSTSFSNAQVALWNNLVKEIRAKQPSIKYFHLSATDGHKFTGKIDANVARLGLGLYGMSSDLSEVGLPALEPVMEMKSVITCVKNIKAGSLVGYGGTFKAQKDMVVATIPCGYYEGVDRRLSNSGMMMVGEERIACPIIGRVSMNITTIDVSAVKDAKIGMPVVVISRNPADANSLEAIARTTSALTYELAVHVPQHLKRVVVE